MSIKEITQNVHWVGVKDPDLKVFDVIMETEWGTTYNSYLVKGKDKVALIEVVKDGFGGMYLEKVKKLVDPEKIDYIILNHTEPDHSGGLADFLKEAKNAVVVSSRSANMFLKEIVNGDFPQMVVKDGDSIDLGQKTLKFIMAPYLHWPDTMFTYLEEDGVLFSGDVFGCHFSSEGDAILHSEIEDDIIPAQRYYFDVIMSPFKDYMLDAIKKISSLKIDVVCPSHGPMLNDRPWDTINRIKEWSADILETNNPKKVFIGYVSAYGNTRRIGEAIAEGIREIHDFHIEMLDVSQNDVADTIVKIDKADALLFGSPTINRDALEPVWRVLSYVSVFKNKGKLAAAFGSYGWSGEAVGMISDRLSSLQFKVVTPGYRTKLVPNDEAIEEAKEFGRNFARTLGG